MFLPIGDEPNPAQRPAMTILLIAINVAVYLLVTLPLSARPADPGDPLLAEYLRSILPLLPRGTSLQELARETSAYDLLVFRWGFRADAPSALTLLTSMFLHGGFMHLFGNMLYLWIYGNNVEARLGAASYLFWYLLAGAAAALFQRALTLGSPIPMVGASGAISGVLGFYLIWFPHHIVKVWVFLFPIYIGVVRIGAVIVLMMFLLIDNLLPFLFNSGAGGVAHGAHIGGFIAGMLAAFALRGRRGAVED